MSRAQIKESVDKLLAEKAEADQLLGTTLADFEAAVAKVTAVYKPMLDDQKKKAAELDKRIKAQAKKHRAVFF